MSPVSEPWHTEKWFTSPWNFLPEVTQGLSFSKSVKVHDVTLRDGEQQAGVEFTKDDKVRIAEALAEAGVHRIEAGLPAVSKADEEAIKAIARRGLPCEVFAFSRCLVEDVKRSAECGVQGVVMEIPSSHHLIEQAYRWPVEVAIERSIEATRFAHDQGLSVSFFPIDATRAGIVQYLDMVERIAREGHMDALGLVDTFGVLSPHAVSYFVRKTRERIKKPLETHFHMDFGLGVANTVMAVAAGAEVIQTTVAGTGERAGNTPMEETVLTLLTMYGLDLGIRTERFYEIARLVLERARVQQPSNRPVIGERLFHVESGIIAGWVRNVGDNLVEAFPFRPELVGQSRPQVVLGKGSGIDSIAYRLDQLGISASNDEMLAILQEVKARSLQKKGLLDEDEFRTIVERVVRKVRV